MGTVHDGISNGYCQPTVGGLYPDTTIDTNGTLKSLEMLLQFLFEFA